MRRIACCVASVVLVACGKVSFGDARLAPDASDAGVVDLGPPDPPDLGIPDVPDLPDMGVECIPVTLPASYPEEWPFERTVAGYRQAFWDWAITAEAGCGVALQSCHVPGGSEPLIPVEAQLASNLEASLDQLWPRLSSARPLPNNALANDYGALWVHHPSYDGGSFPPRLTPENVAYLNQLLAAAWSCGVPEALARQDAGPGCGASAPDAGPLDSGSGDGGNLDASDGGVVDGSGAGNGNLCYCSSIPDAGPISPWCRSMQ